MTRLPPSSEIPQTLWPIVLPYKSIHPVSSNYPQTAWKNLPLDTIHLLCNFLPHMLSQSARRHPNQELLHFRLHARSIIHSTWMFPERSALRHRSLHRHLGPLVRSHHRILCLDNLQFTD